MIESKTIETAKTHRHEAALKWGCPMKDIDWAGCMGMAMRGEELPWKVKEEKETVTVNFTLCRNSYKGSGKAWAAIVELSQGGKVIYDSRKFVEPVAFDKDNYKLYKEYSIECKPGIIIETNEAGTKKYDDRQVRKVDENGELVKVS